MKTVITTVIAVIALEALIGFVLIYTGTIDISASAQEGGIMRWILSTTRDRAISARAGRLPTPSLTDSNMIMKGFEHYHEMCVDCHGAPGKKAEEYAEGLNPRAPNLIRSTRDMSPSEIFVVVKEGIKMTGMPAFHGSHTDSQLWSIVAFVIKMQTMSPAEYSAMSSHRSPGTEEMRHE